MPNSDLVFPYIREFHKNLYSKGQCNLEAEQELLGTIGKVVTDEENLLNKEMNENEIWCTIKSMNKDGRSVEFYLKIWPIIKIVH